MSDLAAPLRDPEKIELFRAAAAAGSSTPSASIGHNSGATVAARPTGDQAPWLGSPDCA